MAVPVQECEAHIVGIKFCRCIEIREELGEKKKQKRKLTELPIQTHRITGKSDKLKPRMFWGSPVLPLPFARIDSPHLSLNVFLLECTRQLCGSMWHK